MIDYFLSLLKCELKYLHRTLKRDLIKLWNYFKFKRKPKESISSRCAKARLYRDIYEKDWKP